ncbi:MAG: Gfo/Idh/MocA family oxidoreductase [Planctomycetes bacterium]|nr:Gfo/Idh/MocA family oxidoreductase [Planctomycetota bacterium]
MTSSDRRQFLRSTAGGTAAMFFAPSFELLHPRSGAAAPISVAVVGAGRQGRAILGELSTLADAQVLAVCDTDDARLQSAVRKAQGLKGYATHKELLEREPGIAGIVIATPTHLHKQVALDALAAGKHVYCETPLAHTIEDCAAIAAAAKGSGKVFAAGFQGRANPVYSLARSFFKSGQLRQLSHLRAQDHKKTSWRTPGSTPERDRELNWHLDPAVSLGLAGEKGAHQLDVFHYFLGRYPTLVRGTGDLRLHKDGRELADVIALELGFDDGLRAHYSCTLASSYDGRYELLAGEMAAIKLAWTHGWMFKEADAPTQGWEVYANRQKFHNDEGITLIAEATKLAAQGKLTEGVGLPYSSLYYSLANFVSACLENKAPACSASEAARTTIVAIHADRAVRSKSEIAIPPELLESV